MTKCRFQLTCVLGVTNTNGSASLRSPHGSPEPRVEDNGSTKIHHNSQLSRERGMTASSYASTAVAPKLETSLSLGDNSLESYFGNMFAGFGLGDRKSNNATPQPLTQLPPRAFMRAVSSSMLIDLEFTATLTFYQRTPNLSYRRASPSEVFGPTSRACLRPRASTLHYLLSRRQCLPVFKAASLLIDSCTLLPADLPHLDPRLRCPLTSIGLLAFPMNQVVKLLPSQAAKTKSCVTHPPTAPVRCPLIPPLCTATIVLLVRRLARMSPIPVSAVPTPSTPQLLHILRLRRRAHER